MKLVDLIPYVEEGLTTSKENLRELNILQKEIDKKNSEKSKIDKLLEDKDEKEHSLYSEIWRTERVVAACESSMEIVVNGTHYDLGDFNERNAVSADDLTIAETLMQMKVGMPYEKMSIGFNYDDGSGFKIPVILTIETVVSDYPFFLIVPWTLVNKNDHGWIQFPYLIPIVCFGENIHFIIDNRNHPRKIDTFFSSTGTTSLTEVPDEEEIGEPGDPDYNPGFNIYTISNMDENEFSMLEDGISEEEKIKRFSFKHFIECFADSMVQDYFLKFIYLLNTKGVSTKTIPVPVKLNKKRLKKSKRPIPSYKVLEFQLPKNGQSYKNPNKRGTSPALHTCMGHTKFYSKENPLFGHYSGPVWCPQHLRGNRDNGVIIKDYELKKGKK